MFLLLRRDETAGYTCVNFLRLVVRSSNHGIMEKELQEQKSDETGLLGEEELDYHRQSRF